jgi:membrane protease subunit HflK
MEDNEKNVPFSTDEQKSERASTRDISKKWKWIRFMWLKEVLHRMINNIRKFFNSQSGDNSAWEDVKKAFRHIDPKKILLLLTTCIICIYVLTGIYVVNPGEQALVKRFGAIMNQPAGEGIHYRFPWPVEEVQKINVSEVRRADVGVSLPEHMHNEDSPEAIQLLTGDENIITSQAIVHYRVKDAAKFLYNVNVNDERLVRDSVEAALVAVMAGMSVDDVLSSGKIEAQNAIVQKTQEVLDSYDSGIQVTVFNIQAIVPPVNVAGAFRDVTTAREDKEKQINQARGYYNSVIPGARGKANQQITQAEANGIESVNTAKGEAGRFVAMLTEYQNSKAAYSKDTANDTTRYRLFLETFEKIFPKAKKFIVDSASQKINVTLIDPNLSSGILDATLQGNNFPGQE